MKDISYTILELQELYEEYDKERLKNHSSYYGLASEKHFTAKEFLIWLRKREAGLTRPDIVPQKEAKKKELFTCGDCIHFKEFDDKMGAGICELNNSFYNKKDSACNKRTISLKTRNKRRRD